MSTRDWFTTIVLAATSVVGCSGTEGGQSEPRQAQAETKTEPATEPEELFDWAADERACEAIKTAVVARGDYEMSRIAGCDGIVDDDNPDGYRVVRMNGFCREELCGSVLMGWFALEEETGRVFEIDDVGNWTLGEEVVPPS